MKTTSFLQSAGKKQFMFVALALSLFLSGCQTGKVNQGTADEVTKILKEVQASAKAVQEAQRQLQEAQAQQIQSAQTNAQFISDRVFSARYANDSNSQSNPYTHVVERELSPAARILPDPTATAKLQIIDNLKLALSKSEADQKELAERYGKLEGEAVLNKSNSVALAQLVDKQKKDLDEKTTAQADSVRQLSDSAAKIRLTAATAERERTLKEKEAASKTRLHVAYIFMLLGGLLAVAGVVATFLHVPGVLAPGLGSGVFLGILGWTITYVEDLLHQMWFQVLVFILIVIVGIVGAWLFSKARTTRGKAQMDADISDNTIGALEEFKNDDEKTGGKKFAAIKPYLEDWHSTEDGQPHVELRREINRRLLKMNLRSARPAPAAAVPAGSTP